jgi:hypothetical protein
MAYLDQDGRFIGQPAQTPEQELAYNQTHQLKALSKQLQGLQAQIDELKKVYAPVATPVANAVPEKDFAALRADVRQRMKLPIPPRWEMAAKWLEIEAILDGADLQQAELEAAHEQLAELTYLTAKEHLAKQAAPPVDPPLVFNPGVLVAQLRSQLVELLQDCYEVDAELVSVKYDGQRRVDALAELRISYRGRAAVLGLADFKM